MSVFNEKLYSRRYLLSVQALQEQGEDEALWRRAYELLDEERRQRLDGRRPARSRCEAMGAGLLLEKAVWDYERRRGAAGLQIISIENILEELMNAPCVAERMQYRYGAKGKPYFTDIPLYFSISHSGGKILCAVAEREVGADIQCVRKGPGHDEQDEKIVERFFSDAEKLQWRLLRQEEKEPYFYRAWTRKEAYGKLLGEGISGVLDCDLSGEGSVRWEEYHLEDAYIAVCMKEKEETSDKEGFV